MKRSRLKKGSARKKKRLVHVMDSWNMTTDNPEQSVWTREFINGRVDLFDLGLDENKEKTEFEVVGMKDGKEVFSDIVKGRKEAMKLVREAMKFVEEAD